MFYTLGPVLQKRMNKCLELWCFEVPDWWQYILESWKGKVKQMPDSYYNQRATDEQSIWDD